VPASVDMRSKYPETFGYFSKEQGFFGDGVALASLRLVFLPVRLIGYLT